MGRKKRTEIVVQTKRRLVVRQGKGLIRAWCERCGEQAQMVTAEEAAALAGISRRTIYRWVEAEKLHSSETPDGLLLICSNSLPDTASKGGNT